MVPCPKQVEARVVYNASGDIMNGESYRLLYRKRETDLELIHYGIWAADEGNGTCAIAIKR